MIRISVAAVLGGVAFVLAAAGPALSWSAWDPRSGPSEAIPPNLVGTWRLDSLLDQARVSGIAPSDGDPRDFVLHDLQFDGRDGGATALPSPFGSGTVEPGAEGLKLTAKGRLALFRIPIPRDDAGEFTADEAFGMVALRVRSSDAGEIALLRDPGMLGGGGLGPGANGALLNGGNFIPPIAPAGGPPPGPPPANRPPPQAAPPPPPGPPPGFPRGFDPRQLLGGTVATFATDGEWHSIGRTKAQLQPGGMFGMGGFGGGSRPSAPLEEIVLVVLAPAEKAESGAQVELEFLHVLDAKAAYASQPAAACTISRRDPASRGAVLHSGMYMNTPCEATWRLVAPEEGRFIAGLSAIDGKPFDLFVHVTAGGVRRTILQQTHDAGSEVAALDVDLSGFAGQEIALTIEAIEEERPTVAFLLQPMVHGRRRDDVRNVLLFFCDTLRADALSCYGCERPTSPALDRMAAHGARFERCFSQGAWTYVSMPSSLSGMYPSVNGVKSGGERIADSVETMAEAFRAAGYLTAAFIRNDFVGETTNTAQGFDFFYPGNAVGAAAQAGLRAVVARMLGQTGANAQSAQNMMDFSLGSSRDLHAKSEPWVEKYAGVPFVLYLHSVDPHDPYDPEEDDWSAFLSREEKNLYDREEAALQQDMARAMQQGMNVAAAGGPGAAQPRNQRERIAQTPLDPRDPQSRIDPDAFISRQRRIYDAEVRYMDRHVERVLDLLDRKELAARTIVSFNSDHGEEFLDHGNAGHGQSVYAELNHVPWILRAPGLIEPGRVVPGSVMNLDLAPTLLALCGVPIPETMQGRDLTEVVRNGEEVPPAPIFTERWGGGLGNGFANDGDAPDGDEEFLGQWAVIEGTWKTVVTRTFDQERGPDGNPRIGPDDKPVPPTLKIDLEIYDLLTDMKDSRSLIETERPRAEAAAKRLETWLREMKKLNARYSAEATTSENAAAALRALGYAQ